MSLFVDKNCGFTPNGVASMRAPSSLSEGVAEPSARSVLGPLSVSPLGSISSGKRSAFVPYSSARNGRPNRFPASDSNQVLNISTRAQQAYETVQASGRGCLGAGERVVSETRVSTVPLSEPRFSVGPAGAILSANRSPFVPDLSDPTSRSNPVPESDSNRILNIENQSEEASGTVQPSGGSSLRGGERTVSEARLSPVSQGLTSRKRPRKNNPYGMSPIELVAWRKVSELEQALQLTSTFADARERRLAAGPTAASASLDTRESETSGLEALPKFKLLEQIYEEHRGRQTQAFVSAAIDQYKFPHLIQSFLKKQGIEFSLSTMMLEAQWQKKSDCMALPEEYRALIKKIVARGQKEGRSVPNMIADITEASGLELAWPTVKRLIERESKS